MLKSFQLSTQPAAFQPDYERIQRKSVTLTYILPGDIDSWVTACSQAQERCSYQRCYSAPAPKLVLLAFFN